MQKIRIIALCLLASFVWFFEAFADQPRFSLNVPQSPRGIGPPPSSPSPLHRSGRAVLRMGMLGSMRGVVVQAEARFFDADGKAIPASQISLQPPRDGKRTSICVMYQDECYAYPINAQYFGGLIAFVDAQATAAYTRTADIFDDDQREERVGQFAEAGLVPVQDDSLAERGDYISWYMSGSAKSLGDTALERAMEFVDANRFPGVIHRDSDKIAAAHNQANSEKSWADSLQPSASGLDMFDLGDESWLVSDVYSDFRVVLSKGRATATGYPQKYHWTSPTSLTEDPDADVQIERVYDYPSPSLREGAKGAEFKQRCDGLEAQQWALLLSPASWAFKAASLNLMDRTVGYLCDAGEALQSMSEEDFESYEVALDTFRSAAMLRAVKLQNAKAFDAFMANVSARR